MCSRLRSCQSLSLYACLPVSVHYECAWRSRGMLAHPACGVLVPTEPCALANQGRYGDCPRHRRRLPGPRHSAECMLQGAAQILARIRAGGKTCDMEAAAKSSIEAQATRCRTGAAILCLSAATVGHSTQV